MLKAPQPNDQPVEEAALQTAPPFNPAAFAQDAERDRQIRRGLLILFIACGSASALLTGVESIFTTAIIVVAFGVWMALGVHRARTGADLQRLAPLSEEAPDQAEHLIVEALRRRPMATWVRLLLYHRLAVLRHQQKRYAESAAICQAVLAQPMGPAASVRAHLLLMLVESRLECGDVFGTYRGLLDLYRTRLSLPEALQRLTLQTRYEVWIGRDNAALHDVPRKLAAAELLPAPQCGMFHALLATAAERSEHAELADWLWDRTKLLCTAEQFAAYKRVQ